MSREIKFRVWDKHNKLMLFPDELVLKKNAKPGDELMQYTELKDGNGKEIYEGDILEDGQTGILYVTEWGNYIFIDESCPKNTYDGIDKKNVRDYSICSPTWVFRRIPHGTKSCHAGNSKIIGNIFENPKLLQLLEERGSSSVNSDESCSFAYEKSKKLFADFLESLQQLRLTERGGKKQ